MNEYEEYLRFAKEIAIEAGKIMKNYPVDKLYEELKSEKEREILKYEVKQILETVKGVADDQIIKKEYDL